MFTKPSKNQYILLALSLVLFVLYFASYPIVNLNKLIETDSIALTILFALLPLFVISVIPSYVFAAMALLNGRLLFVRFIFFVLLYLFISFASLVIFVSIGGLR